MTLPPSSVFSSEVSLKSIEKSLSTAMGGGEVVSNSAHLFDVSYYTVLTTGISSSILLVLVFAGLYTLLVNLRGSKKILTIIPLVLITFVLFIPGVVDIFPIFEDAFQIYRFRYLLTIFFSIIMGVGCVVFYNLFSKSTKSWKLGVVLVIALCLGLVITSPILGYSRDNEVFYQYDFLDQYEEYFDDGDMAAFSFADDYVINTVYSDREHYSYISRLNLIPGGSSHHMIEMFTEYGYHNQNLKTILYPYAKANRDDIRFWNGMSTTEGVSTEVGTNPPEIFEENIYNYNKVYVDNSDIYYIL